MAKEAGPGPKDNRDNQIAGVLRQAEGTAATGVVGRAGLPEELRGMYDEYVRVLGPYMHGNEPWLKRLLGHGSGSRSNPEFSGDYALLKIIARIMSTANDEAERTWKTGCLAVQDKTLQALRDYVAKHRAAVPALKKYNVEKCRIGSTFEHHAVVVYKTQAGPYSGYVFDPWLTPNSLQPRVYTWSAWDKLFWALRNITAAKPKK